MENNNSREKNVEAFRRLIEEGVNQGKIEVLDELFASGFIEHQNGIFPSNLDGFKGWLKILRSAFPDLKLTIQENIAEGDKTVTRIIAQGTHLGPMMGMPPTGKQVKVDVIDICRFEGGKIAEHWGVADRLGMMQQLGALSKSQPTPQ